VTTPAHTFVLNQKLVSMSGDAWVSDESGRHVYEVDGKAFRVRRTVELKDLAGNVIYQINKSLMHVHRTYEIKRDDAVVATIQQGLISIGDRFTIKLASGGELKAKGDIIDHDFTIKQGGDVVVKASRKLISLHDSYGVQIMPGFDPDLGVALVIALEQMELEDAKEQAG